MNKYVAAGLLCVLLLVACSPSTPPRPAVPEPYTTGDQLIEAMQNRYAGRWYRTLTFVQENTAFAADGTESQSVWYEAALLPSRLRIDFDPISAGNGVLTRGDTQYVVSRGSVVRRVPRPNELLILGFDIYFLEPALISSWLRRLGFNLTRIRQDIWQGRQVYVVGAASPTDRRSRQFWVDRDNLLFVRLLQPSTRDTSSTTEIRFSNYERLGRTWIAPLVEVFENGRLVFREQYRQIRIDMPLDTALFDPAQWSTARHWYQTQ